MSWNLFSNKGISSLTVVLYLVSLFFYSCSDGDYTDALPQGCIALAALPTGSICDGTVKGVDAEQSVYLFETADGLFGILAAVSDGRMLKESIKQEIATDAWVTEYNDDAVMVLGPVIAAERETVRRRMVAMLKQDTEHSVKSTPLWQHFNEHNLGNKNLGYMVAQSNALPEQIVAFFTLGTPKGTDPADVLIEATMDIKGDTLMMQGYSCSYNTNVRQSLKRTEKIYRPLTINPYNWKDSAALAKVYMNVDGNNLTALIRNNKALNTALLGSDAFDIVRNNTANLQLTIMPDGNDEYNMKTVSIADSLKTTEDKVVIILNTKAVGKALKKVSFPLLKDYEYIVYRR